MIAIMLGILLTMAGRAGNFNHDGDYEGNGKMNPMVYNESTGEWQVLTTRNNYNPESFFFGGPGWSASQSDYDGDGRTDLVAYNRTTGEWNVLLSRNDYHDPLRIIFGGEGWVVVTGDYDGDGKADPTIYCETTGEWIIMLSGRNYNKVFAQFGCPGRTAVSGDFDGDGQSDPATYQRSNNRWLIACSSKGYAFETCYVDTMGDERLVPSTADYDGDGKTDPAVFAYGCGNSYGKEYVFCWYVLYSSRGYEQIAPFRQLGREDCQPSNADPAPGDYDGDSKADFGVSWPDFTAGVMWRMWKSSQNYSGHDDENWDGEGFRPVQR